MRRPQQRAREAAAHAVRQEGLPVRLDEAGGEDADDLEEEAGNGEVAVVAGVEEAAGHGGAEGQHEDFERDDPGDVGRGAVKDDNVARLEDAEAVDVAPCGPENEVSGKHLRPRLQAAVGRRAGGGGDVLVRPQEYMQSTLFGFLRIATSIRWCCDGPFLLFLELLLFVGDDGRLRFCN